MFSTSTSDKNNDNNSSSSSNNNKAPPTPSGGMGMASSKSPRIKLHKTWKPLTSNGFIDSDDDDEDSDYGASDSPHSSISDIEEEIQKEGNDKNSNNSNRNDGGRLSKEANKNKRLGGANAPSSRSHSRSASYSSARTLPNAFTNALAGFGGVFSLSMSSNKDGKNEKKSQNVFKSGFSTQTSKKNAAPNHWLTNPAGNQYDHQCNGDMQRTKRPREGGDHVVQSPSIFHEGASSKRGVNDQGDGGSCRAAGASSLSDINVTDAATDHHSRQDIQAVLLPHCNNCCNSKDDTTSDDGTRDLACCCHTELEAQASHPNSMYGAPKYSLTGMGQQSSFSHSPAGVMDNAYIKLSDPGDTTTTTTTNSNTIKNSVSATNDSIDTEQKDPSLSSRISFPKNSKLYLPSNSPYASFSSLFYSATASTICTSSPPIASSCITSHDAHSSSSPPPPTTTTSSSSAAMPLASYNQHPSNLYNLDYYHLYQQQQLQCGRNGSSYNVFPIIQTPKSGQSWYLPRSGTIIHQQPPQSASALYRKQQSNNRGNRPINEVQQQWVYNLYQRYYPTSPSSSVSSTGSSDSSKTRSSTSTSTPDSTLDLLEEKGVNSSHLNKTGGGAYIAAAVSATTTGFSDHDDDDDATITDHDASSTDHDLDYIDSYFSSNSVSPVHQATKAF
ncbi:hypothetical protein H4219_002856 [Mycoemilia scoparia]|uniref:Uncharacterized protein n=1 Tax=Mycoemilia scoparia TaxID=417184 RepID=A0A9W8A4F9_9FUNG|nr:hypothetical protein H4219_002856 [Mycoemilia scoparia]